MKLDGLGHIFIEYVERFISYTCAFCGYLILNTKFGQQLNVASLLAPFIIFMIASFLIG